MNERSAEVNISVYNRKQFRRDPHRENKATIGSATSITIGLSKEIFKVSKKGDTFKLFKCTVALVSRRFS